MANDRDINNPLRPSAAFCLKLRFKLLLELDFKNLRGHFNCLFTIVVKVATLLQVNVSGHNNFLASPSGSLDLNRI